MVSAVVSSALVLSGCSIGAHVRPLEFTPPAQVAPGKNSDKADFAAVAKVLASRAEALRAGDRGAFLATLDPDNARLRRSQGTFYDNVQSLPVDKIYYGMTGYGFSPDKVRRGAKVLRPQAFEHVELTGVFAKPVANEVSITFVERKGRWLVASERVDDSLEPQERPWYGAPIEAAGDGDLLVVTDRDAEVGAEALLESTRTALSAAADVLDEQKDRALLVDATTNGKPIELSNASGQEAGAVSFGVYAYTADGQDFRGLAGSVIKANPSSVQQLVTDTRTLRHELTHFLLDGYGDSNPQWVTEGIAEYVGYYPGLLSRSVASDDSLLEAIGRREVRLTPAGLWGNQPELDYLSAEAFAEYLITTYGLDTYREMMDVFRRRARGRAIRNGEGIVDKVLRQVYGVGAQAVARGGFDLLEGLAG